MEHAEFVQSWDAGELEVDVDRSKALQVAGSNMLPKRYQIAHIFWSWVWMLSIPTALAVMCFYTWWAGLIVLVLITPALSRSTKESAMEFMIDHSVENPEFYRFVVSEGVISVRQKPNYAFNRMQCNDGAIMAEVITYKPGTYCQLKLASRERVLISCAQTGIKIMRLGLGGKIPTKTIADWPVSKLTPFVRIFADETNPSLYPLEVIKNPLEIIKNKLMTCSSIREIEQLCAGKQ